jgi:hypothetical protein
MARAVLGVGDDDPCAPRGDENKIRMRHTQPLPAVCADFVGSERNGPVELPNRFYQHHLEYRPVGRKVHKPVSLDNFANSRRADIMAG